MHAIRFILPFRILRHTPLSIVLKKQVFYQKAVVTLLLKVTIPHDLMSSCMTVNQLHLEEPLTLEDYNRVDQDVVATEELHQGWEHEDYQASKTETMEGETLQSDDEEPDDLSPANPLINNYAEATKWAGKLKKFAGRRV